MNDMDNHNDDSLGSILAGAFAKKDAEANRLRYQRAINEVVLTGLKDRTLCDNPLGFLDDMASAVGAERVNKALHEIVGGTLTQPVYKIDNIGCERPIDAIKTIRAATGLGLKEAKDLYEGSSSYQGEDLFQAENDLKNINVTIYRVR